MSAIARLCRIYRSRPPAVRHGALRRAEGDAVGDEALAEPRGVMRREGAHRAGNMPPRGVSQWVLCFAAPGVTCGALRSCMCSAARIWSAAAAAIVTSHARWNPRRKRQAQDLHPAGETEIDCSIRTAEPCQDYTLLARLAASRHRQALLALFAVN